jgi:hypothetical protein
MLKRESQFRERSEHKGDERKGDIQGIHKRAPPTGFGGILSIEGLVAIGRRSA